VSSEGSEIQAKVWSVLVLRFRPGMATEIAQSGASTVVVLPEATAEWQRFPKTDEESGVPPIRLDGSKYLESGVREFAVVWPPPKTLPRKVPIMFPIV
jgi:hypothetical protein